MPKSITETQPGWESRLIALASFSKRDRNACCDATHGCKNFTATGRPSSTRSPLYTTPIAPAATRARIR
jgi:hypothetical protein